MCDGCYEGTMSWGHRGKDSDPGQVVPEGVSLGWNLPKQMGKDVPH